MGIFDSSTKTKSRLDVPDYMRDIAPALTGELRGLIGQPYLTPDQLVAGMDPALMGGIESLINYGGGTGADIGSAVTDAGMAGIGGFGAGQDALMNLLQQGPVQNTGIDMGQVGSYIDNDLIASQIAAALRDPTRMLMEQQLPAARMAAAATGNTGSTRRDVGEAILQRGYEDRAADVSAGIRGDAYRTALGIGADQASQNAMLGAGWQDLVGRTGSSLVNTGMAGANLLQSGSDLNMDAIRAVMQGGAMLTEQDQRMLDAGKEGFLFPYTALPQLTGMAGDMAKTYGTHVSKNTSNMGIGNTLLGAGLAIGGGMMGMPGGGSFLSRFLNKPGGSPSGGTGDFNWAGNPFANDPFQADPFKINPYG